MNILNLRSSRFLSEIIIILPVNKLIINFSKQNDFTHPSPSIPESNFFNYSKFRNPKKKKTTKFSLFFSNELYEKHRTTTINHIRKHSKEAPENITKKLKITQTIKKIATTENRHKSH